MSVTELMNDLAALGIEVWGIEDRIRYRPREAMTPELAERIRESKGEVLAFLREQEEATAIESAPILPISAEPGTPPERGCFSCAGREYHKVKGGPEWICTECHPASPPAIVVAHWTTPLPSLVDAMRRRRDRATRFDLRGLGKRRTRQSGGSDA